ncbi:MAG: hypothetical protein KJ057_11870 [Phycisphaerae bacterium]|nr:MAG: hypothetical protein EDS66_05440 [Planctomycetota bacterium]KAB2940231.1 MAG: hypothetical protein F9K17_14185 [Phycisphaerae bacterium]MBE7457232.1 hypothetical protein [Planctomycetia bacterium]MCK6465448.1 hypothetical protein [Phycisphaerae bacterium]MCL4719159.1 hypothetical protein [Phycisphaerae bacterium]
MLAGDFSGEAFDWEPRLRGDGPLLINATRVGMTPNEQDTPMPPDALSGRTLVFDEFFYDNEKACALAQVGRKGCSDPNGMEHHITRHCVGG